jgi:hypothetical protein
VYLRFDGLDDDRQAYAKTILAKLMREDLGLLTDHAIEKILAAIGPDSIAENLLAGAAPDELARLLEAAGKLPHFLDMLKKNGVVVGVEAVMQPLPGGQATIVFPSGGSEKNRAAVFAAFRLLMRVDKIEVKESKIGERTLLVAKPEPMLNVFCWAEGEHAVIAVGSTEFAHTADLIAGKRENLLASPAFKQVSGFHRYPTYARGYASIRKAHALAIKMVPDVEKPLAELGVDGVDRLSFHFGYQGEYLRSTIALHCDGNRKGLFALFDKSPAVDLAKLPALPPKVTSVTVVEVSLGELYDRGIAAIRTIGQIADPAAVAEFDDGLKQLNDLVGVDIRNDLLGSLGTTAVAYNAPSEGVFIFGTALMWEIKDREKFDKAVAKIVDSVGKAGVGAYRKKKYRGSDVYVFQPSGGEFSFGPSFAVHQDRLIVGFLPQAVQGAILRSNGKYATWKPAAVLKRAIAEATETPAGGGSPPRVVGVDQLDPRPTVEMLSTIAPLIGLFASIAGQGESVDFDFSLIPNTQAINEWLSPNASVLVDDGRTLRYETYSTIPMPIDLSGFSSYGAFAILPFFALGF